MRKYGKTDANQTRIVEALRKAGCSVQSLASVGSGCPDLLASRANRNYLLEVKNAQLPPSQRRLTPDEERWHRNWSGQVAIVHSPEEALAAVGLGQLNSLPPLE